MNMKILVHINYILFIANASIEHNENSCRTNTIIHLSEKTQNES